MSQIVSQIFEDRFNELEGERRLRTCSLHWFAPLKRVTADQKRCPPSQIDSADSGHASNALAIANRTGARPLNAFPGLICHLIACSPAGAILWKCCASDFSRCAAANKMRLAVKSPCIFAAARCALSAFRGRAELDRSRSMRRSLRATEHRRNANGRSSC